MKTSKLTIDGTTYELAYDFNALIEAEAEARCNLLPGLMNLETISAKQLRGVFLGCVRGGDPASTMTLDDAGKLLRYETIFPITEAIAKCLMMSLPEKKNKSAATKKKGRVATFPKTAA